MIYWSEQLYARVSQCRAAGKSVGVVPNRSSVEGAELAAAVRAILCRWFGCPTAVGNLTVFLRGVSHSPTTDRYTDARLIRKITNIELRPAEFSQI